MNFSSSIIWGAIGPGRLYSFGKQYSGLLHLFWLGALLPVLTYFARQRWPENVFLKNLHWPLFFAGTGNVPPVRTGIDSEPGTADKCVGDRHQLQLCLCCILHLQQMDQATLRILVGQVQLRPLCSAGLWVSSLGCDCLLRCSLSRSKCQLVGQ